MFDLVTFIRQQLPGNRRTTLNVDFVKLFFAPIASLLIAIETTRTSFLLQARATGQVLVLEELLNRAVFGAAVGGIYILDGNTQTVDFQVIIPSGLSSSVVGQLAGIVNTYKQPGTRFAVTVGPNYTLGQVTALNWESSFPYLNTTQLVIAINKGGVYPVTIDKDGVTVYSADITFVEGVPVSIDAYDAATYVVNVGTLTATLTRATTGVISAFTYQRSGTSLSALITVNQGDVEVKLLGRNSTTYADTFVTGSIANTTVSGTAYNRKRTLLNIPDGDYTLQVRVAGLTAVTSIDFTLATVVVNQPPVVVSPMPDQSGKVGVYFTYPIPGNVFTDPDGYIASYLTTGLPPGITHSPGNPIAGTPTTAGTYTVRVMVTDNGGLTVYDEFALVILPADSTVDPNPPVPPASGTTAIIRTNTDVAYLVAENNGTKWRVRDTVGRSVPGGQQGYWYLNGHPHVSSLPTEYEYDPGDELTVFYVIATSDDVSSSEWNVKSYTKVVFGTI